MTIEDLKNRNLIILDCISGSRAYGLATENSDTDIKGVFLMPKKEYYGLDYIPQVSNATNDIVYYELGRFLELLAVSNPNILELLATPDAAILHKHRLLNKLSPSIFLSKKCKDTFGKFALSQIKKAKGLKKKILNPVEEKRKSILDFCYVNVENGSKPVKEFLRQKDWAQEHCGLINIAHMKNVYGLYYGANKSYAGIIKSMDSTEVRLSSILKGEKQETLMYFNKDGYSVYCKDYREYWDWVKKRNVDRFEKTMEHGKNYDAKNMMHTFRLLEMAIEIGRDKKINVHRTNRDFLLAIKNGEFEYRELLEKAEVLKVEMEAAFATSNLPEAPDRAAINELAYRLRSQLYEEVESLRR